MRHDWEMRFIPKAPVGGDVLIVQNLQMLELTAEQWDKLVSIIEKYQDDRDSKKNAVD